MLCMGETNLVYPCKWNCSRNRTNIYHPQTNRKKNSSIWIEICHQQLQSILITEQMEYFSSFGQHVPLSLMIATRITHTNHDAVQINCVYSSFYDTKYSTCKLKLPFTTLLSQKQPKLLLTRMHTHNHIGFCWQYFGCPYVMCGQIANLSLIWK